MHPFIIAGLLLHSTVHSTRHDRLSFLRGTFCKAITMHYAHRYRCIYYRRITALFLPFCPHQVGYPFEVGNEVDNRTAICCRYLHVYDTRSIAVLFTMLSRIPRTIHTAIGTMYSTQHSTVYTVITRIILSILNAILPRYGSKQSSLSIITDSPCARQYLQYIDGHRSISLHRVLYQGASATLVTDSTIIVP